jgi:hypothetical protein
MVLTPCLNAVPLGGQSNEPAQPPIVLSNAVTSAATVSLVTLLNKTQDGTAEASDVQGAVVALRTLFAHMQETGLNDQIQRDILSREDEILNSVPSEERVQELYTKVKASGAKVEYEGFRNSHLTTQKDRQQFLTKIKKVGLLGLEKEFLAQLQMVQQRMKSDASLHSWLVLPSMYILGDGRHGLMMASGQGNNVPRAHLQRVGCKYTGYAVACALLALASLECPPAAIAFAVTGIAYDVIGYFAC